MHTCTHLAAHACVVMEWILASGQGRGPLPWSQAQGHVGLCKGAPFPTQCHSNEADNLSPCEGGAQGPTLRLCPLGFSEHHEGLLTLFCSLM